ncbi:expressed tetratricopeptide repeat protein [Nitzschia inconspicua]|uniref:Expressed tetratricopeptide repeat protein n=1 Tax=Nitzschia inconspicua TaxID=303405 RepID=A0A9K3LVE9_9STRA|nr:expressed tetratricopeptide repeat protein [Nitzschia inconspicua]
MERCAKEWNNVGASQLVNGMFSNAIDSFTRSLRIVRCALPVLATSRCSSSGPAVPPQRFIAKSRSSFVVRGDNAAGGDALLQGLYVSPLYLTEIACNDRYETMVEASIAVMFNLALAHHLNCLLVYNNPDSSSQQGQRTQGLSALGRATALYELAYTVHMQEETDINVEFTMAIVNNLGQAHRLTGDDEKADRCFRHLLSTMMFLRSCGGGDEEQQRPPWCDKDGSLSEIFTYSVSYLVLRRTAAAAA